jgi:outer membrane protein OmpA-like peptidoglycan-associated protein
MIRLLLACTIVVGLVAAETTLAQEPSTEDVVKALVPTKKLRGPRGLIIQGEDKPPSIDLYIPFEYNSDKLKTEALLTLKRLGAALKDPRLGGYRFKIAGHTDAKGSAEYNQKLSERRAEAVRNYIVSNMISSEIALRLWVLERPYFWILQNLKTGSIAGFR